jgi:hypothetical protein
MIQAHQMVGAGQLRAGQRGEELTGAAAAPSDLEATRGGIERIDQPNRASQLSHREQPCRAGQCRVGRADLNPFPTPAAGP